jgi:hypothetical protein
LTFVGWVWSRLWSFAACEPSAEDKRGFDDRKTLDKWLACRSLRAAAAALHVQHSSVSYQLAQAEKTLGLHLDDPRGRLRADITVALWRMSDR